jgi:N-acetylglucosaminyl-diphospho-decaprenol L-rhamnosyltransferase
VVDAGLASGRPRVAALLLNWRRADLTLACLAELLAAVSEPLAVLVIDNGSWPLRHHSELLALRAKVAALAGGPHKVELLELPENLGFAGGMNRGLAWAAAAGCEATLVLNNDLQLPPGFLQPLGELLRHDPRVVAVSPTVLHPDGTVWAEGGELACRPNALRLRRHGKAPTPVDAGPLAVPFVPCACVLFRTQALVDVGGFDEDYFMYWEDVDLCDRLAARGGRIVWLPWVRVVHASGQSSGGGRSPLRKFLMANNAVRYLRRRGRPQAWLGWLVFDVLLWPLLWLQGPAVAMAKLRGTLAGLRGHRATAADVERYAGGGGAGGPPVAASNNS